jgi:Arc/MetJ-type ribon-helix-helix transcriptional regulator
MTNVIRSVLVADKAISVRLDAEAQRALAKLTAGGASQSEAIRQALLVAEREAWLAQARADAKRLANDPENLKLIAEIQAEMEDLNEPR